MKTTTPDWPPGLWHFSGSLLVSGVLTTEVSLDVFSPDGRRVRRLELGIQQPGHHQVLLDARDRTGHPFLLRSPETAGAASPSSMTYQGRLTDASGLPQPGGHDLIFRIYSDCESNTCARGSRTTASFGERRSDGGVRYLFLQFPFGGAHYVAAHDSPQIVREDAGFAGLSVQTNSHWQEDRR